MYNIKKLNAISGIVYDYLPKSQYLVSSHIEDADVDGYLVRSANCHELELTDRLLAFARAGAGVNNIPIDKCTEKGIVVFNSPGANANAVKELVLCGLLMASRNVLAGVAWAKTLIGAEGDTMKLVEKGKSQFVGPELMGKTLGVIGLGAIGVLVANAAASIGMNVIGYDPYVSVESAWHLSRAVHRAVNLDDLLSSSDYITVHIPLMDKTRDFISSPEIDKMKDGVILLNFARNGIVRSSSLLEALDSGKIAQYVTDFPTADILGHEKTICIPHLGASTPESEENCAMMAAAQLRDYIEFGSIKNSVNMPACVLSEPAHYRLTVIHKNLPTMVNQMTSLIAKEDINIEEMVNKSRGEIAYTVFDLSSAPSEEIMQAFGAIDGVLRVREIHHV
ncbi:phosphoglycerate dehydrogenase [Christensenellaceae bacterium NSJ-63]|uniref:D-3-phosphoglycerate dehydrogenase n=1 Tax=Guopingia tenuis TaxID=2763656 RepID=A0A926DH44_9FIRM|nr:phosphoglycerate dehydrogenase [Guopingia tenuis]MBC8538673.1 phosphoglycerate dehydrogenase [Guopingia tenuis]